MTEELFAIEKELKDYEAKLYAASTEYKRLAQDAATKRATYDVAYATEFLKITTGEMKMTVPATESLAVQNVQESLTSCRIAEALADGAKRHLVTLQSIISSIQTRAGLFKTEKSFSNIYA